MKGTKTIIANKMSVDCNSITAIIDCRNLNINYA